ncbi:MAG: hypothetical protein KDA27_03875 [Candidatus Eisenbacteria bacterium]|uniref:HEAT repeat domain-containing protein n=1 Tax=Eiseniibacteriota bacterium TaxID=2212470 RepID=A0A956N9Y8_UNCEI|nr:hypothetical protein [Candidatus Eisenbacteria bacterium]MCB9463292.1 hypothetical protein [Candidatus Eisenbacteria bacterium]
MSSSWKLHRVFVGVRLGAWIAPVCAATVAWSAIPCDQAAKTLAGTPVPQRIATATEILQSDCQPLLPEISNAIRTRHWSDAVALLEDQRISLLDTAIAAGYGEAADIAVRVLEKGAWPDGTALNPLAGAKVVEALAPALDRYRVLLLLDVYEQVQIPEVSLSVLEALRGSKEPEALLPALDAYWNGTGDVQALASQVVAAQPETKAPAVLVRLAEALPTGPALDWAGRLGKQQGISAVSDVIGKKK